MPLYFLSISLGCTLQEEEHSATATASTLAVLIWYLILSLTRASNWIFLVNWRGKNQRLIAYLTSSKLQPVYYDLLYNGILEYPAHLPHIQTTPQWKIGTRGGKTKRAQAYNETIYRYLFFVICQTLFPLTRALCHDLTGGARNLFGTWFCENR